MAPFSSDNNGPERRHFFRVWGEFHTSTLYRRSISSLYVLRYVSRVRQKKNIPGSLGKLTRPLFRGESFRENGEKLTSCIQGKAVVVAHLIFVERVCFVPR